MIKRSLEEGRTGSVYWHVLPIFGSATSVFERMDRMLFRSDLIRRKSHESDLRIYFSSGADLFYKSGDKPHNLRTETLTGCIIDECREQQKETWSQVIMPMTAKFNAWCDFYSTPNGHDWFYDLEQMARFQNPGGEWACFHAPATEAPWWTPQQIIQAKANMSEDEFAQEILAEYREIGVGKIYKSHGLHNQKTDNPFAIRGYEWSDYLPIHVGLDFNVGLMCWELGQNHGRSWYFGDEIAVKNTNTDECADILVQKVKGHKLGVVLIGDASGKSKKTSAAGETDYTIIKRKLHAAGIKFRDLTPESNPAVKDRINAMNASMKSADGKIEFYYHPTRCKYLKMCLEKDKWKEGAEGSMMDKSDSLLTHASDAAGYPVTYYSDLLRTSPGLLRMIPR